MIPNITLRYVLHGRTEPGRVPSAPHILLLSTKIFLDKLSPAIQSVANEKPYKLSVNILVVRGLEGTRNTLIPRRTCVELPPLPWQGLNINKN